MPIIGMNLLQDVLPAAVRSQDFVDGHAMHAGVLFRAGQQAIELVTPFEMPDMSDQFGPVKQYLVLTEFRQLRLKRGVDRERWIRISHALCMHCRQHFIDRYRLSLLLNGYLFD